MESDILRKVQLVQLEMLFEIDRVCRENDIRYFLHCGTFLGAVRHKEFIPWDDDLDVAMFREDYDRFRAIAPEKLKESYCFQDWHTDARYPLPFGKLRKKNTYFLEAKSAPLAENGFFVDVFPIDPAPESEKERDHLKNQLLNLFRVKLMKSGFTPWVEENRINWKKRIGYMPYWLLSRLVSNRWLIQKYDTLVAAVPQGACVYEQSALPKPNYFQRVWLQELEIYPFESGSFPGPKDYDSYLTSLYGDYMTLPPEEERENRHQIVRLDFGE